ncbi:hypothetical protein [Janibacter limosus]|uniref:hypothetical protein n=1 Tax=Janibacter limosus TaxID=53458 RepID=UPI00082D97AB|nr:hypothetical protein [Janibacter limosus]
MPGEITATDFMSLADIASLAHVQRAVVSMWRRRPSVRGELVPFPEPFETREGQEFFAMSDVVAWLETTGRGNNCDVRADALGHARPFVLLDDAVMLTALDALLCLKARTGLDLVELPADEIVTHASEADPTDDHLVRELVAAGDDLSTLAAYAERLSDSMWDAASAHHRIRTRWTTRSVRSRAELSGGALDLLGEIGAAIALDVEGDIVIHDPLSSDTDLVDAVLTQLGEGVSAHVLVSGDSVGARAARRLHWTQGRTVVDAAPEGILPLVVSRVPVPDGASDPASVLKSADDVQLDLRDQQRALVVGPASVMCDALRDAELDQQRDHFIRLGRLRCALRLPLGLVADGSRLVLGLWVLGGEPASVRVEARRLATADLTNEAPQPDVVNDVATDVVASLTDSSRATHAFRYARLHLTSLLLAGSGPIVALGSGPDRVTMRSGAAGVVGVSQMAAELEEQAWLSPLDGVTLEPGEAAGSDVGISIDAAERGGLVSIHSGSRIDVAAPATLSGVRIVDAQAVHDPAGPRRGLDPLELEQSWPRARRTEPGDVIFCASPRPAAVVDHEGFSVVAFPARLLRCSPDRGMVPEAVARAINDLPSHSPRWRNWRVPQVPVDQAAILGTVLRQLGSDEIRTRERLSRLSSLAKELAQGVAAGALILTPKTTEEGP